MKLTFYPDEDTLYVKLSDKKIFAYGRDIDDTVHLNVAIDGDIVGVEFLYVSDGVSLKDLSQDLVGVLTPLLHEYAVKIVEGV